MEGLTDLARHQYKQGDNVLSIHQGRFYKAKILQVRESAGFPEYEIHYSGWKKTWDEWVSAGRLVPHTHENEARLKQLNKQHKDKGKTKKTDGRTKAAKDRTSAGWETIDEDAMLVPFELPLRKLLSEDWHAVTQEKKHLRLPRKPSVIEILDDYTQSRNDDTRAVELSLGLCLLFDALLPTSLLYRTEKGVLPKLKTNPKTKGLDRHCKVFGGEHFLRMLVKLPFFLNKCNFPILMSSGASSVTTGGVGTGSASGSGIPELADGTYTAPLGKDAMEQVFRDDINDLQRFLVEHQARFFDSNEYVIGDATGQPLKRARRS